MFEDVERSLEVQSSVGIIRSDAVPWQMLAGGIDDDSDIEWELTVRK